MIDYKEFFEELRECYEKHSIEFSYDFRNIRFTDDGNYIPNKVYSKYAKIHNQISEYKNNYWVKAGNAYSNSPPKVKRIWHFQNFESMVYHVALNLAENMGRLPDHLHSRMVLSIDNNEYLKTYIRKFG